MQSVNAGTSTFTYQDSSLSSRSHDYTVIVPISQQQRGQRSEQLESKSEVIIMKRQHGEEAMGRNAEMNRTNVQAVHTDGGSH